MWRLSEHSGQLEITTWREKTHDPPTNIEAVKPLLFALQRVGLGLEFSATKGGFIESVQVVATIAGTDYGHRWRLCDEQIALLVPPAYDWITQAGPTYFIRVLIEDVPAVTAYYERLAGHRYLLAPNLSGRPDTRVFALPERRVYTASRPFDFDQVPTINQARAVQPIPDPPAPLPRITPDPLAPTPASPPVTAPEATLTEALGGTRRYSRYRPVEGSWLYRHWVALVVLLLGDDYVARWYRTHPVTHPYESSQESA